MYAPPPYGYYDPRGAIGEGGGRGRPEPPRFTEVSATLRAGRRRQPTQQLHRQIRAPSQPAWTAQLRSGALQHPYKHACS
jgi:hypothetical protein